ncbi:MAG: type I-C CRISPR-associated protein Cas8c/Csd1 [Nitrospirae bacterium]|nr:type I-C CRISPR-associated protein Cas8c/Csd1 [Nitrospirota bacterium]MBF0533941.1 type I-C CRISPR-associated protein Cas8c/Csd1 [Nitrospirota bacterium]MBF0618021.1 type I-C CRISPR-associated protein Cas8c/Csd1 [Nitrospirota bacterium]
MLNELMTLNMSLKRCELTVPQTHPWFKIPARKEGFIVCINSDCKIETLEHCTKERMVNLWKIMPDNQNSFPVINFSLPIWQLPILPTCIRKMLDDKDVKQRCNKMKEIIQQLELSYTEAERDKFEGRICGYPTELLKILDCNNSKINAFCTLINRLQSYEHNIDCFLRQLYKVAVDGCLNGSIEQIDLVEELLFGKWNEKKKKFICDIPLIFDLADYANFNYRIAAPDLKNILSEILLRRPIDETNKDLCSLSGEITVIEQNTFPQPSLPKLGPTFLFSMNKDAPCHSRYGKVSSDIFPVGKDLLKELNDALKFIVDEKREGKTWKSIPGKSIAESDLLIVYLEDKPESEINLAELLNDADESEFSEAMYEKVTTKVCSALEGEEGITKESLVRVFVLRKIDPGRRQIVLNSSFTVKNILTGVTEWQVAAKNHPIILPLIKDQANYYVLSPASVMRCFQYKWIRNGTEKTKVSGIGLQEVYDILLGVPKESEHSAKRLLSLALQRQISLVLGIGEAIRSDNLKILNKFKQEGKKPTLKAVTLFSILLYKLGHKKEVYMKEATFNVGRLLALSDDLHIQYCKHVRKNEIPPQLIGNALMSSAMENPERAITRLWNRLLVYQAWANKVQGEEYTLVKWILGQIGKVCAELASVTLPRQTTDADKTKMLLGYLARSEGRNQDK